MTSPRSTYGGGYYSAPSFPDTPIYDSLVAERGTPQIAPIRVPAAYDSVGSGYPAGAGSTGGSSGYLPALPAALPALPSAPVPAQQSAPAYGYPYQQQSQQPMPLQQAAAPYVPQQAVAARGYTPQPQPQRPSMTAGGYEAMRPGQPRPVQVPVPVQIPAQVPAYEDQYGRPYPGRGY
ncbi:hypothetical protein DEJ50_30560 [Streptomyces venezuelae]|uniref:Uncharacterized protein n=1 Tax=Streptomyces venezuelae TaxID=54571 RepID=A0A5P2D8Z4_STRVZ|nr:DUF6643 family protein [Streptomyces venezuelae]QES51546.1 hypothetical protein DEJ50_30560 [Streptomyces venezuelae]